MPRGRGVVEALVLGPTLAAALAIAVVAVNTSGDQPLTTGAGAGAITAQDVRRVMLTTPSPYGDHRRDAARGRCTGDREPGTWSCVVRYRTGHVATLAVAVGTDGAFRAVAAENRGVITGCCITAAG